MIVAYRSHTATLLADVDMDPFDEAGPWEAEYEVTDLGVGWAISGAAALLPGGDPDRLQDEAEPHMRMMADASAASGTEPRVVDPGSRDEVLGALEAAAREVGAIQSAAPWTVTASRWQRTSEFRDEWGWVTQCVDVTDDPYVARALAVTVAHGNSDLASPTTRDDVITAIAAWSPEGDGLDTMMRAGDAAVEIRIGIRRSTRQTAGDLRVTIAPTTT